jgi:hypothetical protein
MKQPSCFEPDKSGNPGGSCDFAGSFCWSKVFGTTSEHFQSNHRGLMITWEQNDKILTQLEYVAVQFHKKFNSKVFLGSWKQSCRV